MTTRGLTVVKLMALIPPRSRARNLETHRNTGVEKGEAAVQGERSARTAAANETADKSHLAVFKGLYPYGTQIVRDFLTVNCVGGSYPAGATA